MSRIAELSKLLASNEFTQQKLADETGVILDVDSLVVFSLNETGMFLVEAIRDGVSNRDELVDRLVQNFEVDEEAASEDVDAFVAQLAERLIDKRARG
jgi:hypothetical protein